MKNPTEKQLRAQADKLNSQLREFDKKKGQAERAALVGRCFKFRNSFGSDRPEWWLYLKVTAPGEWWPTATQFQHKSDGTFELQQLEYFSGWGSYVEIEPSEFNTALAVFREELGKVILSINDGKPGSGLP